MIVEKVSVDRVKAKLEGLKNGINQIFQSKKETI